MERNELIKALESMLTEKIPYGDLVGAEGIYAHSGPLVYEDPESYFIEQAIGDVKELSQIKNILGDDYDLSRLRDLVQADREGRCIIAPVKPGEIAWGGHARFDPVLGETKNVIYPVILKGWWTGLKDYEYEPREFRFGDLYESYDAAEKALEGENHG